MRITVLYVGSSLLAPLTNAEREINRAYRLDLRVAAYNFGAPLSDREWQEVDRDLAESDIVFVIHVMDGENASRLVAALESYKERHDAVVVINCMPELMRHTRMGRLDVNRLGSTGAWIGKRAKRREGATKHGHQYLKLVDRLPGILKFIPTAGALTDAKHYLYLFCYFLQPTPANIQAMLLYSLKHYVRDERLKSVKTLTPEKMPSVAIYHPAATSLFESFEEYRKWYVAQRQLPLDPESTIGLLLMRPQVVSKTTKHYDALIKAIEKEGLSVIPAIATLMDNREAVTRFFRNGRARVSQIVSLTGFSFVGGPAMNDSAAAAEFLRDLNVPYRSAVSLDTQTIEAWRESQTGLNPVQAGMQIAIPEIDGATEPFIYGGIAVKGQEPTPLADRCDRLARRLKRWNNLRTAARDQVKLAVILFCFPPNKGNIGTAADLDVFPSIWDLLKRLRSEGYSVDVPATAEELREKLLGGNSESYGVAANVAHRMTTSEYLRLCPYVRDVEKDWGAAPGRINSFGGELLIQGLTLGNVFIGVQPTFGFEGDPMRLMMARSGSPHHGFMAFYTYLSRVFNADGVIHFGTHGALEFMPGKQIGLSGECWPDRLIDELPNFYVYSVNNPSEGSIAKRRSYAELISYLTPPIENAGLYRELAQLKDQIMAYRQSTNEAERAKLFDSIEALSSELHF
ncbi:MAG TPA: cobaltochelatase subunit CobN [Pyrinomonadaceae bacterium]|jgi:magnesium chelatase subunit H|nr:cobaltochelatase subunit CobN [Pyrinomonadaceae bacterium]